MTGTIKTTVLASFTILSVSASTASAQTYTLHDGESGPVDFVAVQVLSGDSLSAPNAFLYDPNGSPMPGWTQVGSATSAYATFPSAGSLDFDVALVGSFQTANANLMLYGFSAGVETFRESMTMGPNDPSNGGGNSAWNSNYLPLDSTTEAQFTNAVPEPTTLVLAGLGGLSLFLHRQRK